MIKNYCIFISPDTSYQYELQHNKVHRCYGVLRRADLYPLSRDCLFLIWKDIGGGWQRVHRRKCRVGCSLEGVWFWIGEGMMRDKIIFHSILKNEMKKVLVDEAQFFIL